MELLLLRRCAGIASGPLPIESNETVASLLNNLVVDSQVPYLLAVAYV